MLSLYPGRRPVSSSYNPLAQSLSRQFSPQNVGPAVGGGTYPEPMTSVATLGTYLAFAALMQFGKAMFVRSRNASLRPATTAVVALYATIAAAIATRMVSVEQLRLRDELLSAEPWRLVGCLLAYERVTSLAYHLWLLLLICEPLERALEHVELARLLAALQNLERATCCGVTTRPAQGCR